MKLTIEFTKKEKEKIMDTFDCPTDTDKDVSFEIETSSSKVIYNRNKYLSININTEFVFELMDLLKGFIPVVKAFIPSVKAFVTKWDDGQIKERVLTDEEVENNMYYKLNKMGDQYPHFNKDLINEVMNNNNEEE